DGPYTASAGARGGAGALPAAPTGRLGRGPLIWLCRTPYQPYSSAPARTAAAAIHGMNDRSFWTPCATTGFTSITRDSVRGKYVLNASSNDAGSIFRMAGASLARNVASELAFMLPLRTRVPK